MGRVIAALLGFLSALIVLAQIWTIAKVVQRFGLYHEKVRWFLLAAKFVYAVVLIRFSMEAIFAALGKKPLRKWVLVGLGLNLILVILIFFMTFAPSPVDF
jgi:ABC-type transport system involved in cytochrome bd biosynthesis fused ATPase/permease subunit